MPNTTDKQIQKMLDWCDMVAVKWKNGGTKKVTPKFKYNNRHCRTRGGYCYFCDRTRKKAYFCNSYVIAAWVHGFGLKDPNFIKDCKKWQGHGCGGQASRDFNPAVKKGEFEVVKGISKANPIFTRNAKEVKEAEKILMPGDVLMIARGDKHKENSKATICHTAMWYGDGMITEAAGDAGCCTRSALKIDRGQKRRIVKVYRKTGQSNPKKSPGGKSGKTSAKQTTRKGYSGKFPTLPKRGYFRKGDRMKNVEYIQKFLNWYGDYGLTVDGYYYTKTVEAVKKFQKATKLKIDGCWGPKTQAKAKTITK